MAAWTLFQVKNKRYSENRQYPVLSQRLQTREKNRKGRDDPALGPPRPAMWGSKRLKTGYEGGFYSATTILIIRLGTTTTR